MDANVPVRTEQGGPLNANLSNTLTTRKRKGKRLLGGRRVLVEFHPAALELGKTYNMRGHTATGAPSSPGCAGRAAASTPHPAYRTFP